MKHSAPHLFSSDNASGVHPDVMARLFEVNQGHALGYGKDDLSAQVNCRFKEVFGEQAESFLVVNGTGANVLALKGMAQSFETIYCSNEAHLLVDECGAPENFIGCKLVPVQSIDGKFDMNQLESQVVTNSGFVHRSQPRVITLAQATERGTVYQLHEIEKTVSFARKHNLLTHIDGARIANAAVALGVSFKQMTTDMGIDVVSFGGTKNGLMMAEAIIILNPGLVSRFPYIRKQGMHLVSKHRYLAAQYLAYFDNDLWHRNATQANRMAAYFAGRLAEFDEINITASVDINIIFATMPKEWIAPLQQYCHFNVWDESSNEVRFITSFDTTEAIVDGFVAEIKRLFK